MDREQIRAIVAEIRTYHPATQFQRSNNSVSVFSVNILVPGGATEEQVALLRRWHKELLWYLTTPPDAQGECWRGHPIHWICTSGGIWACRCYYWTPERVNLETTRQMIKRPLNLKYRDYWTQKEGVTR